MDTATVVRQLRHERARAAKQVERLSAAIAARDGGSYGKRTGGNALTSGTVGTDSGGSTRKHDVRRFALHQNAASSPERTMSAATRAKIAKAQRLRWAKRNKPDDQAAVSKTVPAAKLAK